MTIRGREAEIADLRQRIEGSTRSVTLLTGETRIGKSTLLRQLEQTLATEAGCFVGLHECAWEEGRDPLLPCINELAQAVISDADAITNEVLREAMKDIRQEAVSEFLGAVVAVAKELRGIGGLVTVVEKGIKLIGGRVEKARSRLERTVKLSLPPLSAEVFHDILLVLLRLAAGKPLVLIVDNLNGTVATGATSSPLWSALLTHIQNQPLDLVHFVIGWKSDTTLQPALGTLRRELRPYGYSEKELGPLDDGTAGAWLAEATIWWSALSEDDKAGVVKGTGGFPEAVQAVAGLERAPTRAEARERLTNYANKHYPDLERTIRQDPAPELLYQLSLMPVWPTLIQLTWLAAESEQMMFDRLRGWAEAGLLKGGGIAFDWWHESRRLLVQHHAPMRLADGGRAAAVRLRDHYLETAGFASEDVPAAGLHAAFAASLATPARTPRAVQATLEEYAAAVEDPALPVPTAPLPAARLLRFVLATARTGEETVRLPAFAEAVRDIEPGSRHAALNFSKGLFNASNAYGTAQRWPDLSAALERLTALAQAFPAEPDLRERLARGLVNASHAYGDHQRWDEQETVIGQLAGLLETAAEDIARSLVEAGVAVRPTAD